MGNRIVHEEGPGAGGGAHGPGGFQLLRDQDELDHRDEQLDGLAADRDRDRDGRIRGRDVRIAVADDEKKEDIAPLLRDFSEVPLARQPAAYDQRVRLPFLSPSTGSGPQWNRLPDDCLAAMCTFLSSADLANVAQVSRAWRQSVYDSALWQHLDLSSYSNRVSNQLLESLLAHPRFRELQTLSLENCIAVTSLESLRQAHVARGLRTLLLTNCVNLPVRELLDTLPLLTPAHGGCLTRLELFNVTQDYSIADRIRQLAPNIDLGFFGMESCAAAGVKTDGSNQPGACRHAPDLEGNHANAACWGPIKGRVVYASDVYPLSGNYPCRVLYSCATHSELDHTDERLSVCQVCMRFVEPRCMQSLVACKVCFDFEQIHTPENWIPLEPGPISKFTFNDIISRTIRLADRKNLPPRIKTYAKVPCRVDLRLPRDLLQANQGANQGAFGSLPRAEGMAALLAQAQERELRRLTAIDRRDARALSASIRAASRSRAALPPEEEDEEEPEDGHAHQHAHGNAQPFAAEPQPHAGGGGGLLQMPDANRTFSADRTNVPLPMFLEQNRLRLEQTSSTVQGHLRRAMEAGETRALLVYTDAPVGVGGAALGGRGEEPVVEVLADKRLILAKEGAEHLVLTLQAWRRCLQILVPVACTLLACIFFMGVLQKAVSDLSKSDNAGGYSATLLGNKDEPISLTVVLIIAACTLVLGCLLVYCFVRYREACQRMSQRFLVLDILLIMLFGGGSLLAVTAEQWQSQVDALSFTFIVWNLSFVGLAALYLPTPKSVHRGTLVGLHAIMAIMMSAALGFAGAFLIVMIASIGDCMSETSPTFRLLPFLFPAHEDMDHATPRVLYDVGPLKLRASDLMWFGILVTLVPATVLSAAPAFVISLASVAITVFVFPFLGSKFRPLPLAFLFQLIFMVTESSVWGPFLAQAFAVSHPRLAQ